MSRWTRTFPLALILVGISTAGARADQIITTDLYVTATTDVTLSAFQLDLTLIPVGSTTSFPFYSDLAIQPSAFVSDSGYVFFPNSFDNDNGLPFWLALGTGPTPYSFPNGEIVGGDESDSQAGYVTLVGGSTYDLGQVTYDVPSPTDTFQVGLSSNNQTYFDDQNNNPLTIVSYNGGTITISAVPEPSSLMLLAISSGLGASVCWFCRNRKGRPQI
jgi:hypothetical protein